MTAHWGLPDPSAVTGSAAEQHVVLPETVRMLSNRTALFLALPLEEIDRLALQDRLRQIGNRLKPAEAGE